MCLCADECMEAGGGLEGWSSGVCVHAYICVCVCVCVCVCLSFQSPGPVQRCEVSC